MKRVYLEPMTKEMYHHFFREYQFDADLLFPDQEYIPYCYDEEKVNAYVKRQMDLHRIPLAVMCGEEIVGELIIKNIEEHKCATLGITMKNAAYKDKGFGTQAEEQAIDYVFHKLDIPILYADSILKNTRSQHVLEKVGFVLYRQDDRFMYYKIERNS